MIEKTLVILNTCTVQRPLAVEIFHPFSRKRRWGAGSMLLWLTDG